MRGTIHLIPARDLGWVLSVTAERQLRQAAAVHRGEGIDADEIGRAERAVRAALGGGNRARTQGDVRRARRRRSLHARTARLSRALRPLDERGAVPGSGGAAPRWSDPRAVLGADRGVGDGCRVPGRSARGVLLPIHRIARARPGCATSRGGRASRSESRARLRRRHPIASTSSPTTANRSMWSPAPHRGAARRRRR